MRARLSLRCLAVVGVVMIVAMMVVVPMSYLYNHLGIGRRIQGKKHTQRTQCEQTSLDVNVHERLPVWIPAFEPELVGEMPNRGWQEDLFSRARYGGASFARCSQIAVECAVWALGVSAQRFNGAAVCSLHLQGRCLWNRCPVWCWLGLSWFAWLS
jgi:hypothetical protein